MFRDVPECSGMFRVPGFIDAPENIHNGVTVHIDKQFLLIQPFHAFQDPSDLLGV